MRGRKPMPVELAELHGFPSDRKPPAPTKAKALTVIPAAPGFLDDLAQEEFRRLAESMSEIGMLTPHDVGLLAVYCSAWSQFVTADLKLQEEDYVVAGEKGQMRNPWFFIKNAAIQTLIKVGAEFGMSPSSRMRVPLQAKNKSGAPPGSPIDENGEPVTLGGYLGNHPG